MNVIDDLARICLAQETIVTIGAFDGVHRAHQALIAHVVDRAHATGRLAVAFTFHPHPAAILAPDRAPRYLTTPGERVALFERLGLDLVVLYPFNREVAATSARDFVEMVSRYLNLRELWVGADFALGRNREGDVPRLRELGRQFGYEVHVVHPIVEDGEVISSSRIRSLLYAGRVEEAARLLGRYPSVSGEVVAGARRGRILGFPTANLEVRAERATPANGVYAVLALLGDERYPGAANVGVRPTFDNGERLIETHIFDFEQDIYGCDLVVEFVARLRDELKFDSVSELMAQMARDSEDARHILAARGHGDPARATVPCSYRFREVEHTADRALWVWGADLAELYVGAARGMFSLMGELGGQGLVATEWQELALQALDRESLLVAWLNELLYLAEVQGLLLVDFQILSRTDTELQAQVGGVPAEMTKENIKAATFHGLELVRDGQGWSTVITFDV